ncbi:MAG TPA: hypothetical protein VIV63_15465 [Steroidobacteraceae bacterium]
MKKLVLLLLLVLAGVYGVGRMKLGEAGAMRFLADMEALMNDGNAEEVCAMFHEDLEVEISDRSGDSPQEMSGDKEEFCALTTETAAGLHLLPHSMSVNYTDVNVTRNWLHPWTSEVSYLENRSLTIRGANVTLRTVSEDEITLVHTFSGVKLLKLKSDVHRADAT